MVLFQFLSITKSTFFYKIVQEKYEHSSDFQTKDFIFVSIIFVSMLFYCQIMSALKS